MKTFRPKKALAFTLVEIMIVVLIIGILLAIAIPNFVSARESSRAKACVGNLKQLDSGSQQFAMDNKLNSTASLSTAQFSSLAPTYIRTFPSCPESGAYSPGATLASSPTCSIGVSGNNAGSGDYASTANGGTGRYYHGL